MVEYFRDINSKSRSLENGTILSEVYLLAAKVLQAETGDLDLEKEVRMVLFRTERMLLSKNRTVYWSRVFRQQSTLATTADAHPLKAIGKFIFQNMWLDNQQSRLGEDSWPSQVKFSLEDTLRLLEGMVVRREFDEALLD